MLDALRRGAQSWLAKILFAILIVSFGIFWNVSDVFRGFGRGSIAQVGEEQISAADFQRTFHQQLEQLRTEDDRRLTTEQALLMGLHNRAIERLVAQSAIKQHAGNLDLALSDADLAEGVRSDPAFAGPDGKFSRLGFEGLLRQMGLTEQGFFKLRREDELRRQVTDALTAAVVVPKPLIDEAYAWQHETRTIEHFKIDESKVTVPEPDETKLRATYEQSKSRFMTPEYRKLVAVVLSLDDLKKEMSVTDEELKAAYEDEKDTYDTPERRRIQQIAFKDKATAEEARKALVEGKKNFLDVAKENGASEQDVSLGLLSKKQMIDKKVADAAFSLQRDEISPVIDGRFAPVIVRAIEIEPGKESTFEEVKDKVRDKLAKAKAQAVIQERFDLVEEGRNAGKTLKEVGTEQKLRVLEVEATDKSNQTPDGKTAIEYPDAAILLKEVFAASPGADHEAIELPSDSYAWFDILSATEAKQRPFEDVKEDVKALYVDNERSRLLDELAAKLVDRLKAGEDFAKVAADGGGKPETSDSVKRQMSVPDLTQAAVKQAFALPKGGAGFAETSDGKSRIVFQVKEIVPAEAATKEQEESLARTLRDDLRNDQIIAYIGALRDRLGVSVNTDELKRATGQDTEQ
jgi:peptidyl-prolyl cis-trans isomerase D